MKVIDLLNKIANGEEVPKKIMFAGMVWNKINKTYENDYNDFFLFVFKNNLTYSLNDEVEIIEEDKEIEKIKINLNSTRPITEQIEDKINEIIIAVNELKKGK